MKTPVNSIVIPAKFVRLCAEWHGGQNCLLYAVLSTGNLTLGSIRPNGCDTPEKHYLTIWRELSCDVGFTARQAKGRRGVNDLREFEKYCEEIVTKLETEYELSDWEN